MKLLLDSHAWLWFSTDDARLSPTARSAIELASNTRFVSAATMWELSIKISLGKLRLDDALEVFIPDQLKNSKAELLPVEIRHCIQISRLPMHHRDPFDRMLIAQAIAEGLTVVSTDAIFDAYSVSRIW